MRFQHHVHHRHVGRMPSAANKTTLAHANAYRITLEIHTMAVDRNVLPTANVQIIWHAWVTNAKIHVQAYVARMLSVVLLIIRHNAIARPVSMEIRWLAAIKKNVYHRVRRHIYSQMHSNSTRYRLDFSLSNFLISNSRNYSIFSIFVEQPILFPPVRVRSLSATTPQLLHKSNPTIFFLLPHNDKHKTPKKTL